MSLRRCSSGISTGNTGEICVGRAFFRGAAEFSCAAVNKFTLMSLHHEKYCDIILYNKLGHVAFVVKNVPVAYLQKNPLGKDNQDKR